MKKDWKEGTKKDTLYPGYIAPVQNAPWDPVFRAQWIQALAQGEREKRHSVCPTCHQEKK